jgi:hypothetical protein
VAWNLAHSGGEYHTYAVSADGQHFLYFQRVLPGATPAAATAFGPEPVNDMTVALHWQSALKK